MRRLLRDKTASYGAYPGESSAPLIVHTPGDSYSQNYYGPAYRTAQQLISGLQLVQTNERVIELARDIEAGWFDDISSLDDAAVHWDAWMGRTRSIFGAKGIALPGAMPPTTAEKAFVAEYNHVYQTAEELLRQLPMPQNNYRVVALAQAIKAGAFADISPVREAGQHWAGWMLRARDLFRQNKTLLAQRRLRP